VIEIIRTEDEPKAVMMAEFGLTDRQAEAILNMRLRSLRRLEEFEIKGERDKLDKEQAGLAALLADPKKQRQRMKRDLTKIRDRYGADTPLGKRRTTIEEAAPTRDIPMEAMIEREPITVILSRRGWVRAMRGHVDLAPKGEGTGAETMKFKEGDGPAYAFHAQTTDKLLLAAENGRFFTLPADKLPGGRGFGEPVRAMIDLDGHVGIVAFVPARVAARLLVVASDGRGFVVPTAEVVAETRKGKTVLTPRTGSVLKIVRPIAKDADYVAAIGDNRRLVVFPLDELPELSRGTGVQLQRFRDGGLSDAVAFVFAGGLSWPMGGDSGRTRTEADMNPWRTARGAAGRMPPNGFPRNNRFDG
jgi:topoisomerase-4 subunit A